MAPSLQDFLLSLRTTVGDLFDNFLRQCQNEKECSAAVEIGSMFDTTLESASSFAESIPRDEPDESRFAGLSVSIGSW